MDSSDAVKEALKQPILVVGCGSIGRRHIRNLKALGAENILAYDRNVEAAIAFWQENRYVDVVTHFNAAIKDCKPIAALICSPTHEHIPLALACALEGVKNIFVEKPVSDGGSIRDWTGWNTDETNTLVACNFRFTPGLRKVKELIDSGAIGKVLSVRAQFGQYLPDQREDYQQSYAAHKSMGGGVILDRIHEFDYLSWLLGPISEVKAFSGHLSSLEIDTEDVAEIICRFESGAIGSIHLDYIDPQYTCECSIYGEDGSLYWGYRFGAWQVWHRKRSFKGDFVMPDYWGEHEDPNDMYLSEMKHFLRVCAGEEESCNTISDAYKLLEVVLRCKQ